MSTTAEILEQTTAFLTETLEQPDIRTAIFTTLRTKLSPSKSNLKQLNLAAQTLENAITTMNTTVKTSSLRLSEKLLLSYPQNIFSSFLLSLIYKLCQRDIDASFQLLNVFEQDPTIARLEIAPKLFENMFLINFVPVLEWYNEQRSKILSSLSSCSGYESDENSVVMDSVVSCTTLLSKMNGNQAFELKELERDYEKVLDENCRVFVGYFKEVLGNNDDENRVIDPPLIVLEPVYKDGKYEFNPQEKSISTIFGSKNGRYNPIWTDEGDQSIGTQINKTKTFSKFPSFFPERVSPRVLTNQRSSKPLPNNKDIGSESDDNSCSMSSFDSDAELEGKNIEITSLDSKQTQSQKQKQPIITESSYFEPLMEGYDNPTNEGKHTPPKDFVCPITTQIFNDPVTLETGQTYERKAIQQWVERGNSTCPITRQNLHSTQLPKTNYVLKRLIASWKELNPSNSGLPENEPVYIPELPLTSPDSVISQATTDGMYSELKDAITKLCTSEVLKEAETAVFKIERFWQELPESDMEVEIQTMLSQPPVINGFIEILFSSIDTRVLIATVYILSELGSQDNNVVSTLTRVDSDVECVIALFKKGLFEAVVLIYLLKPSTAMLLQMEMVDSLLSVVNKKDDEFFKMCVRPKAAAMYLLGQIVASGDDGAVFEVVKRVISGKVIECIISSLESEWIEERITAIRILLRCIQEDGKYRNVIADKAELAPVLEILVGANDQDRFEIVQFLSELVKLNRRTFNNQILHIIKDEGSFSTMHTLLIYLQTAAVDQLPIVAGLLLQLDLLVRHCISQMASWADRAEPRKMSIYREEAIDTLISCLKSSDSPSSQIAAAETILALQGRFTSSGKPLVRTCLLKHAGLDKSYRSTMRKEQLSAISGEEEEKAAEEWERKTAFVLVTHEFGLIFEALSKGLQSRYAEICSACFVSATWLVHMLTLLPDTGIRGAARTCLLNHFVSIFKSAKDTEDKALSMLTLSSFIHDPDGLRDIKPHMKDILKGLREFKKSSTVAFEMLKVFSEGSESSADLWNHKELTQQDCISNGEVLSVVCVKDKIISGHSDGMIKVWTSKGGALQLIQEIQEHSKAVTSLTVLQSGDTLYSGSHDKTVRGWSINKEMIQCEQVYDVKDHVNNLLVANSISCFIPQGAGIKIHAWSGSSKLLNASKSVKSLALVHGRLYSGCQDNSIQEIDLATGTLSTIQSGSRKLLGKSNPVHALSVHDGLIYSASSSIEGTALKIWNASNYTLIHSVSLASEVRTMVVSSDMIYMGCKGGFVEVWCRKKLNRKETLQTGTNSKVMCMALDSNEDVLVVGTSDGRLQAWEVS